MATDVQVGFDILNTTVDKTTKKITCQLGSVVGKTVDTDGAEYWQQVGFASRPPKPDAGKEAAQAVSIKGGDRDTVIATQDLRGLKLYGSLEHGETCIYAAGEDGKGQARILLKKDGSVALYTLQGNDENGQSCTIQLLPSGEIHLATPFGGISITDGKMTLLSASGAGVECSASGVSLLGQTIVANGSVMLGDATATGVATQVSMLPMFLAMQAMFTAMQAFFNAPSVQAISAGTAAPMVPLIAAVQAIMALPTTFSLKVKAS